MDVVTPTDRPKSVRNRCIIEFFVALFVFSLYPFYNSVGIGASVIGLSQISSFFLYVYFFNFNFYKKRNIDVNVFPPLFYFFMNKVYALRNG